MPGKYIRVSYDGDDYDMPEEEAFSMMDALDHKGSKFDAVDIATPKDPPVAEKTGSSLNATAPSDPPPAVSTPREAAQEPKPERSWAEALTDTLSDGTQGVIHGATLGFDDEIAGALLGDEARDAFRDRNKEARERTPGAYIPGDMLASMLLPAGNIGRGAKAGAGALAKIGGYARQGLGAALEGGISNGLREAGDRDSENIGDRLESGAEGFAKGFGIGGAVGSGSAAAEDLLRGGAKALDHGADLSRLKGWGVGGDDLAARAEQMSGREGRLVTPGEAGRDLVRQGERIVPPNRLAPRSPDEWAQGFAGAAGDINTGIDEQLVAAQNAGARLPTDVRGQVAGNLYGKADDAFDRGFDADLAGALDRKAGQVNNGAQQLTPQDVRAQKIGYDQNAFKGAPGTPENLAGQANLAAANEYRGILGDFAAQGGDDIADRYSALNQDYGTAATLRGANMSAAANNAAAGGWVPQAMGAAAGGFIGGPLGAAGGAAVGYGLRNAGRSYGADLGANVARLGAQGLSSTADGANWMVNNAPTSMRAYASLTSPTPQPIAPSPAAAPDQQAQTGNDEADVARALTGTLEKGRGYLMADVAMQQPELLEQYASDINTDDEDRASADIERLARTNPDFAARIMPRLRQRTEK